MQLHVKECPNVEVVCNQGCGAQFPRALREKHASVCPKRLTSCTYCGFSIPMDTLEVYRYMYVYVYLQCVYVCVCVCVYIDCRTFVGEPE